ncbi:hypothetical protein [Herbinix luporum]|jgi:hypothetical protein|uniref:Putative membrane protein n=1 Tax=Herbinix luporum TaxID=1679721 RepID=A0A0K8J826_9FIRM|nr:hypothetical protein [Herbinix luporum]CUH93467.1 putative membrane protein [Herbinix luporum]HHT56351.1 hypothetical protein [Herbinix luporum]
MGWLRNLFKKTDSVDTEKIHEQIQEDIRSNTYVDKRGFIKENCEIIAESSRQIDEAKIEYQAVTSYLNDMQKIDLIPKEQRESLEEAARNIINLNNERKRYQNRKHNITDIQYRLFERDEMQIPKELTSIREAESYQTSIDEDIRHLEHEKQSLLEQEDDIKGKQSFLRGIAIATCAIIIVLFIIFALLSGKSGSNMTLPFLLTVLMGMASTLYIFMEARKNAHDIKMVQIMLNKVIVLSNKVTIKSVNNRNYLDYIYSKYMVDNYEQFKSRWEEYVKLKDENKRYQNNTELLEFYNEILIRELKRFHIADADIWIYQPSAIIDRKEMVEVRHRLNVRRQKLRERMEANQKQKDEAIKAITSFIIAHPQRKEEVFRILNEHHIPLDILK